MTTQIVVTDLKQAFDQARYLDGSMSERLDVFANATRMLHPTTTAIVDRLIGRLKEHDAGQNAPKPGDAMPPFVLPDETGRLISLKDLLAQGPAVVTFHRGHWCPYCRININTLVEAHKALPASAEIVAIMPDRQKFVAELRSQSNVPFPILTDMDNGYALSLNLTIWVGAEMQKLMEPRRDLPTFQGNGTWMLPIPATFVVGRDGVIRARFTDPDYRKPMAIADMLAALRS